MVGNAPANHSSDNPACALNASSEGTQLAGKRVGLLSYGSGSCSEFYSGTVGANAAQRMAKADVEGVLADLGVGETVPVIEAWNKLDLLEPSARDELLAEAARRDDVAAFSALTGEGVDELARHVAERLTAGHQRYVVTLAASDGAGAAWLHQHGEVLGHDIDGDDAVYEVRMAPSDYERFEARGA